MFQLKPNIAMSPCARLRLKIPSWEIMWSCLHVSVCLRISGAITPCSDSARLEAQTRTYNMYTTGDFPPRVVCVHATLIRETYPPILNRMVLTMGPKVNISLDHLWRLCLLCRRTSERAGTSSSSSRSCSRLISLPTVNIVDAVMVFTLKWWPGSCRSFCVRHVCTELHTQLIWVEDAHQDAHMEADKTQTPMQTRTWRQSFTHISLLRLNYLLTSGLTVCVYRKSLKKLFNDFKNQLFHRLLASTSTVWWSILGVFIFQCPWQPFAYSCIHKCKKKCKWYL